MKSLTNVNNMMLLD